MNRIFRTVWNAVRGKLVAVEESKTGHAQAGGSRRRGTFVAAVAAVASVASGLAGAADEVQIMDGEELVLTGVVREDANTWSDESAKLLPDTADGGTATVHAGGKLTFGNYDLGYQTAGWIQNVDVAEGGTLTVKSGDFGIKGTYSADGTTDVQKGSILHVENSFYANNKSMTTVTDGRLHVGTMVVDDMASVTLTGTSEFSAIGETTVYGHLTISNESTATFEKLTLFNLAQVELGGTSSGTTLTLNISPTLVVNGTSSWQDVEYNGVGASPSIFVNGTLTLAPTDGEVAFREGMMINNSGKLDLASAESTILSGSLVNGGDKYAGTGAYYGNLTVEANASDQNNGYETGDILTVNGQWINIGLAEWNGMTVQGSAIAENYSYEALNVTGEIKVGGNASFENGGIINTGTLIVDGGSFVNGQPGTTYFSGLGSGFHVLSGTVTNNGTISMQSSGVDIQGGQTANAAGASWEFDRLFVMYGSYVNNGTDSGTELFLSADGSWTNNGISSLNSVEIYRGTAQNAATGSFTVGSAERAGSFQLTGGNFSNLGQTNTTNVATVTISSGISQNGSTETIDTAHWHYANLTVTGGSSTNHATEEGNILTVSDAGSWTNNHVASWNQANFNNDSAVNDGTLTGSVTVAVGGSLTGTGSITGDADDSVTVNGTLEQGSVATGTFTNTGTTTITGTLDAAKTTNSGKLTLGTVTNFDADNIYVHDGANANLAITDGSHFTGTNLVFAGGGDVYVTETNGNQPNFLGLDNSLGNNAVTIKGEAAYEMTGDHTASYPEGTTTVYVDRLGSETDLTLDEGGRLVVDEIDFDGTQDTTKLAGGVLSTSLGQIFGEVSNEYVKIDAESPDDTANVDSEILGVSSVGDMKGEILAGIDFEQGALGFTDEAVSASTVAAAANAVSEAAGNHAADIDVVFDGDLFGDSGVVGDLTLSDVSDLFAEQAGKPGSAVTNPGVILASTSLDATGDADGIVTVGGENADIAGSIGFESIKHADSVQVEEGRGTLIGGVLDPAQTGENFNWADDNRLIESDTAGSGGSVTIGENGRYDFGSKGTADKHTGWVDSVSNDGTFNVTNGEYGIKGDLTTTANGESTVQDDAALHVGGVDVAGDLVNDGLIVVDGTDGLQKVEIDEGGSFVQNGTLDTNGRDALVAGDMTTSNGANTAGEGSFWHDMTVTGEGSNHVASGGKEEGNILDLSQAGDDGWIVDVGGESHWNKVVDATGSNDGTVSVGDDQGRQDGTKAEDSSFNVAAGQEYVNTGDLDLKGAGNTVIDGTITTGNGGTTNYDDLSVNPDGTVAVENGGHDNGDILDLTPGGDYSVDKGGKADWNEIWIGKDDDHPEGGGSFTNDGETTVDKVVIGDGGSFDNTGTIDGGELDVSDGAVVNIDGGNTDFDKTVIGQNGWLVVGNGETPSADDKAVYDFNSTDTIEGDVFVINNGELVFSGENTDETFDDLVKAPQLPDAPVKVVVGGTVHVGSTGSLNIGNSSYTKPAADAQEGDRGTANVETGSGNLFFGSDSTTVISVPGIGKGPAFTTDSTSATVTVEDGATLILGNVSEAGQYLITDGFFTQDGTLIGGWLDEEHLYALNEDGTGLNWVLDLGYDSDSIWVDVSYSEIDTEYPDMVLPDNVHDNLQHGSDPRGPQDTFINEILKDKTIGVDEKTRIVNSVAQIAAAGGVFGSGFDNMTAAVDALESRVSFAGETFTHDGRMVTGESGTDLWAVVLGGTHSVDSNTAAGRMSGGYDADTYGIMAGLDHKIRGTNWRTGVTLSYQEGDLDSTGDWVETQTDYDTFGIQAYANYSPNQHFNLIGSVGYFRNGAETTMGLPAASKTFRKASADVDMDMFAAAVRMEGRFDVGSVSVIPHAGVRMLVTNAGQYSTKLDGQTAFESDADSLTTGQLPIGVAVRGDFTGSNGWTWRPTADVTVMPQFGDVDALTHVRGADTGITESLKAEMTGHFVATGSLGLQAEKGNLAIGVGYGYTGGMSGQSDHSFNANVRWRF